MANVTGPKHQQIEDDRFWAGGAPTTASLQHHAVEEKTRHLHHSSSQKQCYIDSYHEIYKNGNMALSRLSLRTCC